MINVGIFFLLVFVLFLISRQMSKGLSRFFYRISGEHKSAIVLMAIFYFPGTFVHEVSHYITALLLGVHAGKMEFMPQSQGNSVKMGSVSIAKTDPVRRFLIGVAPVVWGILIILGIVYFVSWYGIFTNLLLSGGVLLAVFIIGNTMYSSRRDMEGALGLFATVAFLFVLLGGFFWYTGTSLPDIELSFLNWEMVYGVFETGWKFLLVPILVDVVVLSILHFLDSV